MKQSKKDLKRKLSEITSYLENIHNEDTTENHTQSTVVINDTRNHDKCDACGGVGQFICCEECPNAFHFTCVDPPLDPTIVLSSKEKWFCNTCRFKANKKKSRSKRGLFCQLLDDLHARNPLAYQLPLDIIHFFEGVTMDNEGRYVDTTQIKQHKSKHGQIEHPDYMQLKDKNGHFRQCYHCRKTALKKPMIACDYCTLYWHLDCLTPPLTTPPSPTKKWRCPNHIEHIIKPPRLISEPEVVRIDQETRLPSSAYQHYLYDIIQQELIKEEQLVEEDSSNIEDVIMSKEGTVYRLPSTPLQLHSNTRRDSITSSTSSKSEINTPTLFNYPLIQKCEQEEEIDDWIHNMQYFHHQVHQHDRLRELIEVATTTNVSSKRRTMYTSQQKYDTYLLIQQTLLNRDTEEIYQLLQK